MQMSTDKIQQKSKEKKRVFKVGQAEKWFESNSGAHKCFFLIDITISPGGGRDTL